eukprot:1866208-Rhodomonas_salina.1
MLRDKITEYSNTECSKRFKPCGSDDGITNRFKPPKCTKPRYLGYTVSRYRDSKALREGWPFTMDPTCLGSNPTTSVGDVATE